MMVYNPQIWWILMVYNESPYSNCHKLGVHHFQTNPDRFWMVKLGHCGCFLFYFFWMNKRSVPVYKPLSWAFRLRWILGWVLFRSHSIERTAYVCEKAGARLACQSVRFCAAPLPQDWFFRCDDSSKIGARLDPQSRLLYVWSVNSSSFWGWSTNTSGNALLQESRLITSPCDQTLFVSNCQNLLCPSLTVGRSEAQD